MKRPLAAALAAAAAALLAAPASAQTQRTWNFLTTGNGYGFQIFDTNAQKITQFLEHPYRYLRPNPSDPHAEGVVRRNLAFDFYFGVRGGGTAGWLNAPTTAGDPEYVDQSHIIHAPATLGGINAESYFFAPFDYPGNAMVALLKAPGATDGFVLFNFHMGTATTPDAPGSDGESIRYVTAQKAVVETGPGGGFMVYVPLSGVDVADCQNAYTKVTGGMDLTQNTSCSGNDVVPAFQKHLDANGWMAVAVVFVDSTNPADADAAAASIAAWAKNRSPDQILADARMEFESWRKPPPSTVPLCGDAETKLWRQSEAVLRMGQIREPNTSSRKNNGMMLASLPPGSWHTGWVRDAQYAVVALARSGHVAEAKAALNFFLNASPVGAELLLEGGDHVVARARGVLRQVHAAGDLGVGVAAVGEVDAGERHVDHEAAARPGLDDRLLRRHVADALAVAAGRVGRGRRAHVEVEEHEAVAGAGRVQERHHGVAGIVEGREEVGLDVVAAERRRHADDVRLVDVAGIARRRRRVEPARRAAAAHAEVEVVGEVAAHHALGVRVRRIGAQVAIWVLEKLRYFVRVGIEYLKAISVARRQKVPGALLRRGGQGEEERDGGDGGCERTLHGASTALE